MKESAYWLRSARWIHAGKGDIDSIWIDFGAERELNRLVAAFDYEKWIWEVDREAETLAALFLREMALDDEGRK